MENDIEATVKQVVAMLAELREKQKRNELTYDQRNELILAASWLPLPRPTPLASLTPQGQGVGTP